MRGVRWEQVQGASELGMNPEPEEDWLAKLYQGRTYLDCWPRCHVARGMSLRAVRNWVMKPWATQRNPDFILNTVGSHPCAVSRTKTWSDLLLKVPLSVEKEIRWGRWWALGQGCSIQSQMCTFYLPAAILGEWFVFHILEYFLWPFKKTYFSLGFKFQLFTVYFCIMYLG